MLLKYWCGSESQNEGEMSSTNDDDDDNDDIWLDGWNTTWHGKKLQQKKHKRQEKDELNKMRMRNKPSRLELSQSLTYSLTHSQVPALALH